MAKSKSTHRVKASKGKSVNSPNPGRPRPMTPKAGVTKTRRRYQNGGDWCY